MIENGMVNKKWQVDEINTIDAVRTSPHPTLPSAMT
jgi:hypothetical protein